MQNKFVFLIIFCTFLALTVFYFTSRGVVPFFMVQPTANTLVKTFIDSTLNKNPKDVLALTDGSSSCNQTMQETFDNVSRMVDDFKGTVSWTKYRNTASEIIYIMFIPTDAELYDPDIIFVGLWIGINNQNFNRYTCGALPNTITTFEERVQVSGKKMARSTTDLLLNTVVSSIKVE